jgi:hypothetical protein
VRCNGRASEVVHLQSTVQQSSRAPAGYLALPLMMRLPRSELASAGISRNADVLRRACRQNNAINRPERRSFIHHTSNILTLYQCAHPPKTLPSIHTHRACHPRILTQHGSSTTNNESTTVPASPPDGRAGAQIRKQQPYGRHHRKSRRSPPLSLHRQLLGRQH